MGRYFNEYFHAMGGFFFGAPVIRLVPQTVYYYVPARDSNLVIGRIDAGTGYLFWQVTDGGATRGLTRLDRSLGEDDYLRWSVPDTNCPPLPQPSTPLDSGQADEAEPNRWHTSGDAIATTSGEWRFPAFPVSVTTTYACYESGTPFMVEAYVHHSVVGDSGILVGPMTVTGDWPEGAFWDLVYLRFGQVWVGAGYATDIRRQTVSGGYTFFILRRYGWIAAARDASGQVRTVGFGVNAPQPAPMPRLILERNSSGQMTAAFDRGGTYVPFSVPLGSYQPGGEVEVGRRLLVIDGNMPSEEQRRLVLLGGTASVRSIRTVRYGDTPVRWESLPVEFSNPVRVFPDEVIAAELEPYLQWRFSEQLENITSVSWGRRVPPEGGARYWQFRVDLPTGSRTDTLLFWKLLDRIRMRVVAPEKEDVPPGDEPPGDLPPEDVDGILSDVRRRLHRLIPRNMGVYWSYGELDATFYGERMRVPVSFLTALRAVFDWYGHLEAEVLPDAVPARTVQKLLDEVEVCHLDGSSVTGTVFLPTSSRDSVGSEHVGTLGLWLAGMLKPFLTRWLGAPGVSSIVQEVVDTVHAALGRIPWVRDGDVDVSVQGGELLIRFNLRLHGRLERVRFTLTGGGGGLRVE